MVDRQGAGMLGGRYQLGDTLGEGTFGELCLGGAMTVSLRAHNHPVAAAQAR